MNDRKQPPATLYFAIARERIPAVRVEGLRTGEGANLLLTETPTDPRFKGFCVLSIQVAEMVQAGFQFQPVDGDWLVRAVPTRYIDFP